MYESYETMINVTLKFQYIGRLYFTVFLYLEWLSDTRDDIFIVNLFLLHLIVKYIVDDKHILGTYIYRIRKTEILI